MQFAQKITSLMRRRGLSTRSLGAHVGVSNGTVAGWTKGAAPRPDAAKRLADYFQIPVDVLLDDARSLPVEYEAARVEEERQEHMVSAPLRLAASAADKLSGTQAERQAAFEKYLRRIHEFRAAAEKVAGGNSTLAAMLFDRILAGWLAIEPTATEADWAVLQKGRDARNRAVADMPFSSEDLQAAQARLDELIARAAAEDVPEHQEEPDEKHRHA